jgi:hypothetical protein
MTSIDIDRRQIGPIGTASRVVGGLIATGVPIALEGITWWDAAGLVAMPFIATAAATLVTAGNARYAPDALTRRHAICSGPTCALAAVLVAAAFGVGAATPAHGDVVLWAFLGISMLLAAARGDGGCEVLAFPNAITGRSDQIGCLIYTPIDAAEARHRARLAGSPTFTETRC